MKKLLQIMCLILLFSFAVGLLYAQKPTIKPFGMTADKNKNLLGLTRTPSATNGNWQYWWITSGLPVVPAGTNVYVGADTINGAWALTSKPSGSTAAISKIKNAKTNVTYDSIATFVADMEGSYIVSYTVGTKPVAKDTFYAGKYVGVGTITDTNFAVTKNALMNCGSTACHASIPYWGSIVSGWAKTKHATIFWKGITGQLEFTAATEGGKSYGAAYRSTCVPCHTTGFNSGPTNTGTASNGFYDLWLANKFTKPDTTGSYGYNANGQTETMFKYDGSMWKGMDNNHKQLGTIGCEACHGPFVTANHMMPGFAKNNMVSEEISICAQCHDSPNNHAVAQQYLSSKHGVSAVAQEERESWARSTSAKPTNCVKCHERAGFMNRNNPHSGTTTFTPVKFSDIEGDFTCVMCHQPHTADNKQVRLVTNQLLNVSKMKLTKGGPGQVCVYCHQARRGNSPWGQPFSLEPYIDRVDGQTKMDTIWTDALANFRYKGKYPNTPTSAQLNSHYGVQGDMIYGQSFFEFNEDYKVSISGLETHASLEAGCATCHMAKPEYISSKGYSLLGYHTFNMKGPKYSLDKTVGENTVGCKSCHGEIEGFDAVKAANDYDGDGVLEGVQSEVKGMLDKLENDLFIKKWGLTKTGTNAMGYATWKTSGDANYTAAIGDSTKVKILYNYNSMYIDRSLGVHNSKYAIHVLSRSMIKGGLAGVKQIEEAAPRVYELSNNYPNPFNPTTTINFTVPKEAPVKIYIYNAAGQLVATIVDAYFLSGKYTATWDGKTNSGLNAASGVYFYKMVSGNFTQAKKMMLMK